MWSTIWLVEYLFIWISLGFQVGSPYFNILRGGMGWKGRVVGGEVVGGGSFIAIKMLNNKRDN